MKKKTGVVVLILTVIMVGLLAFTSGVGFGSTGTGAAKNIKTGLDLAGGVSITYEAVEADPSSEDMADTIYKLQKRVEGYSEESQVYQEGSNRISIEIPGVSDANAVLEELGTPGSLLFIAQKGSDGTDNYSQAYNSETQSYEYQLNKTLEEIEADGSVIMTGSDVDTAEAAVRQDQTTQASQYVVNMTLTESGKTKFADATQIAFENSQTIGIYYDGTFVSVPGVTNGAITGGECEISGMSNMEEANNLASYIRIGGLNLELNEVHSQVVGAQLGEDAIRTSLIAGAIGLVLVMLFMIFVYLVPGVIASVALLIYTGLVLVLLNAFDLTLTLPGIAGIILGIGMAVDANVIIYARIREEITAGSSTKNAIQAGFQKALSAILDGNITTLIAAAVLGWLGTGSVRGFAMTLALGIVVSMFTALVVSRFIIKAVYAIGVRDEKFYARPKKVKVIDFLGKKKVFFIISIIIMLVGPITMAVQSGSGNKMLNYSLEFVGGTSTTAEFNEDLSIAQLDSDVRPVVMGVTGDANISMQKVVGSNQVVIKTRELDVTEREALNKALAENFQIDENTISAESISSTISNEMRSDAILAIAVATLCMLLYIWFRFKDIRFASSAVLALLHDVFVILAFYAVSRISVGNTFIACMLTIVGYSINATIVIFDRIRENMHGIKKNEDIKDVVNASISQTLTRSIYTSLTTFIMIAVLAVMGVASIREFAMPIMVGIVCGGYSSVCITGALWYVMKTKLVKKKVEVKGKKKGKK
ncbi:MAG: protein translocase subunit SecD [Lachnospiraceae bacterium]|nr:protein translocase subunit SecD [Lachnospiraceae bacterium]